MCFSTPKTLSNSTNMLTFNTSSNAKNSSNVQELNNHSVDITLANAYHWLYYIQTRHLFFTLSFNLQIRLKHERGNKLESVWNSSTLLQVRKSESQHSQMSFHLGSWNSIVFQIFGTRFEDQSIEIRHLVDHYKVPKKIIFKVRWHFPFGYLKHVMTKNKWSIVKLIVWLLGILMFDTRVKCDMLLERSFRRLQPFPWKFLHQNPYVEVKSPQHSI
jgi:hypothetical protein